MRRNLGPSLPMNFIPGETSPRSRYAVRNQFWYSYWHQGWAAENRCWSSILFGKYRLPGRDQLADFNAFTRFIPHRNKTLQVNNQPRLHLWSDKPPQLHLQIDPFIGWIFRTYQTTWFVSSWCQLYYFRPVFPSEISWPNEQWDGWKVFRGAHAHRSSIVLLRLCLPLRSDCSGKFSLKQFIPQSPVLVIWCMFQTAISQSDRGQLKWPQRLQPFLVGVQWRRNLRMSFVWLSIGWRWKSGAVVGCMRRTRRKLRTLWQLLKL